MNIEIENKINPDGDLEPLPGNGSSLFTISRYNEGYLTFFRYDIPSELRQRILALPPEAAIQKYGIVMQILSEFSPGIQVFSGVGCYFDKIPGVETYPDVVYYDRAYVVLVDGKPISRAWVQEESNSAAELAVETLPEYRGQGYGYQVANACAAEVIRSGKIAFYSYKIDNRASAALARKLGVVQYTVSTGYSIPE